MKVHDLPTRVARRPSTLETRTIEAELKDGDIVAWLCNQDREPSSVCAPRRNGSRWRGIYPDFVFFGKTKSGILADIVDPHLLDD